MLHLDVAVEQQGSVVFVVIAHRVQVLDGGASRGLNQLFEVLDEVGQLVDFDVALDHVAWIQVTNCF